jgi:hypothetical protein
VRQEQVAAFQVAVDELFVVQVLEHFQQLPHHAFHFVGLKHVALVQKAG